MITSAFRVSRRAPKFPNSRIFSDVRRRGRSTDDVDSTPRVDLGGGQIASEGSLMDRDDFLFGLKEQRITFRQIGVHADIAAALEKCEKSTATLIQARTFEAIIDRKDVVIGAETGSGKTMAFMVPILHQLLTRKEDEERQETVDGDGSEALDISKNYPSVVVMVPNRELVLQVHGAVNELLFALQGDRITSEACTSQLDMWPYRDADSPDILICTPAILSKFIRGPNILEEELFRCIKTVVFDEADMLFEGSYLRDAEKVLEAFKLTRRESIRQGHIGINDKVVQYVLSAATLPTFGLKSMDAYISKKFPLSVRVSNEHLHRHHPQISQKWLTVGGNAITDGDRIDLITRAVGPEAAGGSTMIFVNTADAAVDLADALRQADPAVECGEFHKLMRNTDKQVDLKAFREGDIPVLICTDAAARGLDLPSVRHVIQAEFALNVVQHLHRIGRASRGGKEGNATIIVDERGRDLADSIQGVAAEGHGGGVERSFSRKRGFRAKVKKGRRESHGNT